jgi:large subunit ribosomal protein L24
MQKVVQRRLAAEHQAVRRAAKQKSKVDNAKEWSARWQTMSRGKQESVYFKEEKFRRREEYEVGPLLAPRRDTGHIKDTYGAVDPSVIQTPKLHWTMYKHFKSPFAVGDRVLVTKGKDAGKIGTLSEVQPESGFARINELRRVHLHNSPPLFLPLLTTPPRPTSSFPNTCARKTRILVQSYNSQCPSAGRTSSSSFPFATRPMVTLKMSSWKRSTCATLDG